MPADGLHVFTGVTPAAGIHSKARSKTIPGLAEDQPLKTVCKITLGGRFFACNDDFSSRYLYGTVIDFEQEKLVRLTGPFNLDGRCVLATVTILFEEGEEETSPLGPSLNVKS